MKKILQDQMKNAMRAKDKDRLSVIRLMINAIQKEEISLREKGVESLDDQASIQVISRMVKQAQQVLEEYKAAGRDDLVEQTQYEITVFKEFLPEMLSEDKVNTIVDDIITKGGFSSIKDMRSVLQEVQKHYTGQVDMTQVSQLVKSKLS